MAKKPSTKKETPPSQEEPKFYKVQLTSGDSFVRLPNRMIVADGDWVVVSKDEFEQLKKMKVC